MNKNLKRSLRFLGAVFIFSGSLFCTSVTSRGPATNTGSDWRYYGSTEGSSKFSYLKEINRSNVAQLKLAWVWDSIDNPISKALKLDVGIFEATPLMVADTLYTSTSLSQVAALDPQNGREKWTFDPKAYLKGYPTNLGFVHRGVAYWESTDKKRIFYGTGDGYLISLLAETGKVDLDFGAKGFVDLAKGQIDEASRSKYSVTSPPIVCKNTIIIGSSVSDFFYKGPVPRGDVRGFDAETGKLKWTFHTVPKAGEQGTETWLNNSWQKNGNTNSWTPLSADSSLNSVYVPISTPTNDYYGGDRPGDGLYGESLVSLDCETGKKNWHYQFVHHGLWDYDPPSAPILMDVIVEGRPIKAITQLTKQAFAFVLDRTTGLPVWPVVEKNVPPSRVPGEHSSLTQRFPTLPPPFDEQGMNPDTGVDLSLGLPAAFRSRAIDYLNNNKIQYGPLYTPPSESGFTLMIPGVVGGSSWAGGAYNPGNSTLYVGSVTYPYLPVLTHYPLSDFKYVWNIAKSKYLDIPKDPPLTAPPYGRITAIDMTTGKQNWITAIGKGPKADPLLQNLNLTGKAKFNFPNGDLGWPRRIHVLATPDILFAAQSGKWIAKGVHYLKSNTDSKIPFPNSATAFVENDEPVLRALDPLTGQELAKVEIPGNAFGAPMTYFYKGKQYIVMAIGGANLPAQIIALALPN